LIIECVHCHAKYQYDDSKFDGKPSKKIRCAKCQQVFEIFAAAAGAGASAPAPPPPKPKVTDDTVSRPIRTFSGAQASSAGEGLLAGAKRGEGYPPLPDGKRFSVAIIDGPDSGSVIRIDKSHVVIGRAGADVPLNDNEVSRNHAAIDIRGALMLLEDTGSTNGTLVHGERITAPIELQNHSEFTVGSTTLMLIITEVD
jgi:predicted Zn finger-like uncharacterized protein